MYIKQYTDESGRGNKKNRLEQEGTQQTRENRRKEREKEKKGEKGTTNRGRSCIIRSDEDNAPWFAHHPVGVSSFRDCTGDDVVVRAYVYVFAYV